MAAVEPGPIRRSRSRVYPISAASLMTKSGKPDLVHPRGHGVWVLAFARTTPEEHNVCVPWRGFTGQDRGTNLPACGPFASLLLERASAASGRLARCTAVASRS